VVEPLVGVADDAEVEVVPVELVLLLPQAAITRHAVIAVSTSNSRNACRRILVVVFTGVPVRRSGGNQSVPLESPALLLPVVRTESLIEVAVTVLLALFTPWMTTVSPEFSELLETLRFFASSVLEASLTLDPVARALACAGSWALCEFARCCHRGEGVLGARLNMYRMSRSHLCGTREESETFLSAHDQAFPISNSDHSEFRPPQS
jgi:hypothetical protein